MSSCLFSARFCTLILGEDDRSAARRIVRCVTPEGRDFRERSGMKEEKEGVNNNFGVARASVGLLCMFFQFPFGVGQSPALAVARR